MRNPLSSFSRKQLIIGVSVAVLAVGGVVLGLTLSTSAPRAITPRPTTTTTTVPPTTTSTTAPVPPIRCPLTGLPAPRGKVPARPALAVKVGNEPDGARPQSGLNEADIVFDTPAEGFIMRYIAVFQCENAASIGPTRSVRWVDWHLVRQFIHPILAFAGGINPNVDQVAAFNWLRSANLLEGAAAAGHRTTNRVPPDNLYTSTAALYGLFPKSNRAPKPVFTYSAALASGSAPVTTVGINFSYGTDVVWKWDAPIQGWLHTYSGVPDVDTLTGKPVTATNVVMIVVDYHFGPHAESTGGSGDFESQTVGSGTGWILRNGRQIKITWTRPYLISPFTFRHGKEKVALAPGRTWVELVPKGTATRFTS